MRRSQALQRRFQAVQQIKSWQADRVDVVEIGWKAGVCHKNYLFAILSWKQSQRALEPYMAPQCPTIKRKIKKNYLANQLPIIISDVPDVLPKNG